MGKYLQGGVKLGAPNASNGAVETLYVPLSKYMLKSFNEVKIDQHRAGKTTPHPLNVALATYIVLHLLYYVANYLISTHTSQLSRVATNRKCRAKQLINVFAYRTGNWYRWGRCGKSRSSHPPSTEQILCMVMAIVVVVERRRRR